MAAQPHDSSRTPPRKPQPGAKKSPKGPNQKPASGSNSSDPKAKKPQPEKQPKPTRRRPVGVREELQQAKEVGRLTLWIRERFRETPAWVVSAMVHAVVLILLALVTLAPEIKDQVQNLIATNQTDEETEEIEELNDVDIQEIEVATEVFEQVETENVQEEVEISEFDDTAAAEIAVELSDIGEQHAPKSNLMNTIGSTTGKGFDGRGKAARAQLVAEGGGNGASEAAVGMGLKWIASHQLPDGGWYFDHGKAPTHVGPVNNPGKNQSRTGATAMALLPFLGAGQTHMEGEYKETCRRGLYFLGSQIKMGPNGGDLRGQGGNMYCHGLAAIVLCEAYALTQDKALMVPAQQSLNFIVYAQDKTGGGWRYAPQTPGDTSAVGWQVMALKSGHLAYLQVPKQTIAGAINFLNLVQSDSGAFYGYTAPAANRDATTAVGLLCRMYLGWKKEEPALQRGVAWMSKRGPTNNMYFNYYATQIMHHYGGEEWKKWNAVMRDQLVNSQITNGDFRAEKGSWTPKVGGHIGESGGRLYETSMCTMTLEVYYRHMPLYKDQPVNDDF